MENKCIKCERPCCIKFKLTKELTNPRGTREQLNQFPYIKKVGSDVVRGPSGREMMVGVYSCDRFNLTTGNCEDYDLKPRPAFCSNTGELFLPHNECLFNLH